ncbi:MAG: hypothetical protein HC861_01520 [Rhodospirillaceae bacterium]|nr:hypothetical protein [Rhodospirillaceae bacterium]
MTPASRIAGAVIALLLAFSALTDARSETAHGPCPAWLEDCDEDPNVVPPPTDPDLPSAAAGPGDTFSGGPTGEVAPSFVNSVLASHSKQLRKLAVTPEAPRPPLDVTLYLYVLPGIEVGRETLKQITEFHYCLPGRLSTDDPDAIAYLVLPSRVFQPGIPFVDLAFSSKLLHTIKRHEDIDEKEVYFIATAAPIVPNAKAPGFKEIRLGRIAPQFVGTWLYRMQATVEAGEIKSPESLDLALRSVLTIVGSLGAVFGIDPAQAAEFACPKEL